MSQQLAKNDVKALITGAEFKIQVGKVLPKHITVERMGRVAMTAIMKNPDLMKCTPASVMNSLMLCAQAGLEPDGRNAHLIPYGNTCQVIFDWKGLVSLAMRNGYEAVFGDKVCEADEFEAVVVNGKKELTHKINWKQPRGEAYAYYTVCQRNGTIDFEVMTKDEVDDVRKRSRSAGKGPWVTDYDEMAKKSVIRRMSKRWDLLPEIRDAIFSDDDTPEPLGKAQVTAPLFKDDTTKKAKSIPVEAEVQTETAGVGEQPAEEPEPEPSQPTTTLPEPSPSTLIQQIRKKLTSAKIAESSMLTFLIENIGVITAGKSLEEVFQNDGEAFASIAKNIDDIIKQMKDRA